MVNRSLILADLNNHYIAELATVKNRWVRRVKAEACQRIALILNNMER